MPTKPSAIIADLIGNRRPDFGPTGLQDGHIIGRAFFVEDQLEWIRTLFSSEEDVNFVVLPENERGSAVLGVAAHLGNQNNAFDRAGVI